MVSPESGDLADDNGIEVIEEFTNINRSQQHFQARKMLYHAGHVSTNRYNVASAREFCTVNTFYEFTCVVLIGTTVLLNTSVIIKVQYTFDKLAFKLQYKTISFVE